MSSDAEQLIASKLDSGDLPSATPVKTWAGYGSGKNACAACGGTIQPYEVEVEASYPDGAEHFFHAPCKEIIAQVRHRSKRNGA